MTPLMLTYVLPTLVGYAFFLVISGGFQPFRKPTLLAARPSWLLGLWCGISIALVSLLTTHMVNPLTLLGLQLALIPASALWTMMLVPGIAVYFWYRSLLRQEQEVAMSQAFEQSDFEVDSIDQVALPPEPDMSADEVSDVSTESDQTAARYELDETLSTDTQLLPSDEAYDGAFEREYNRLLKASSAVSAIEFPVGDAYSIGFDTALALAESTTGGNVSEPSPGLTRTDAPAKEAIDAAESNDEGENNIGPIDTPVTESIEYNLSFEQYRRQTIDAIKRTSETQCDSDQESTLRITPDSIESQEVENEERESARIELLIATELLTRERALKNEFDLAIRRALQNKDDEVETVIREAKDAKQSEIRSRLETEKHLRITRRALTRLEAEVRQSQGIRADELIELERQLEEKIKLAARAESAASREQSLRSAAEQELLQTKQAVLAARKDARRNTEARAKVLVTANKAISFARQSVDARARTESELQKLKEQNKIHQATISSLIETLDHEKSKSREEVSFLSKQLMQKEIELEKKSLGAGNLTSRLVKKVARARPVS